MLLILACEVRLETMAALDGEPFPSMVHVGIGCWGGGGGCTDLRIFCGSGIARTYRVTQKKKSISVYCALTERKTMAMK